MGVHHRTHRGENLQKPKIGGKPAPGGRDGGPSRPREQLAQGPGEWGERPGEGVQPFQPTPEPSSFLAAPSLLRLQLSRPLGRYWLQAST